MCLPTSINLHMPHANAKTSTRLQKEAFRAQSFQPPQAEDFLHTVFLPPGLVLETSAFPGVYTWDF